MLAWHCRDARAEATACASVCAEVAHSWANAFIAAAISHDALPDRSGRQEHPRTTARAASMSAITRENADPEAATGSGARCCAATATRRGPRSGSAGRVAQGREPGRSRFRTAWVKATAGTVLMRQAICRDCEVLTAGEDEIWHSCGEAGPPHQAAPRRGLSCRCRIGSQDRCEGTHPRRRASLCGIRAHGARQRCGTTGPEGDR